MTMQVRGYNCVRRDVDGDASPTGGVCLFTSHLYPSNVVTLHTSLQAVAVRIHIHSLVTVCCVYLTPNDVVPQVDLNHLVSQLPALLSNTLWGADSLVTPSVPSTNTFTFGLWLCSVRFCSCICIKTTGHSISLCSENRLWCLQNFACYQLVCGYHKADTADVIYQQLFSFHRSKYSKYLPVYTDGSKAVGHVGCGVFNNTILGFSLHHSMSVFSAELTAILIALQHILISNHRHFCVYTNSMSALESLHFFTERRHPTVIEILVLLRKLERKGFHIIFSWVPGHVGILGNGQADTAARSMSDHMQRPFCYRDLKISTQNYIHRVWQET
ncbi:RNase H domain-containing protein [Trichonephila clavipes]|nr:RNase H domain-containing protein [Trichonephila clavipes]